MPIWLIVLCIITLAVVLIVATVFIIRRYGDSVISKLTQLKPKVIVYKADKDNKKDELQN